jgi:DNA-binding MarR family transcriptional regulator
VKQAQTAVRPKAGSPTQLGFEALVAVLHVQAHVIRPIDDALERAHGTSITGFELLARLAQLPDGASVRFLSDQVVVSPSRVSRVADEFVSRGLLERTASPHDGRLSLVRLTGKGERELDKIRATFERAVTEYFLNRLTASEVRALIGIGRSLGAPHC